MIDISKWINGVGGQAFAGVARGAESFVLAQAATSAKRDVIYIASGDKEMHAIRLGLAFFAPSIPVITLPAWDCLPYDRASPRPSILAERIVAISSLLAPFNNPRIILTTINAVLQKLPPAIMFKQAIFSLKAQSAISHSALTHFLNENGYRRVAMAMEAGEFAVRGNLIDIIASGENYGIRLDSFGDTLETIRIFDPVSQRSEGTLTEVTLRPASEVVLNASTVENFRKNYREHFGANTYDDPLYEAISSQRAFAGMEHMLPLFYDSLPTVFDYAPDALIMLDAEVESACKERLELIREYYSARKISEKSKHYSAPIYHPLPPDALYLNAENWQSLLAARATATLTPFVSGTSNELNFNYHTSRNFAAAQLTGTALFEALKAYGANQRAQGRSLIIGCYSLGSRERIASLLHEHELHPLRIDNYVDVKNVSGKTIGLVILALERGFEADHITVLSEQDLLGERIIRSTKSRKKPEQLLSEAAQFMPGELVVHREHGIGRFEDLVTLEVQGAKHDCLKIIYDGNDKLFLPVENIELLSRYGSEEEGAKLDKLGSASWQARKARLKERITLAAEDLMRVAAARALDNATSFTPPQGLYEEFCARFPYAETEDQARAIDDILGDIASGKPTDRLVCGDVGFGKTEVAMRAAFVVASGQTERGAAQVAIVCPTTLLCRQHFYTFSERFKGLPFTVCQLSRLTSTSENKKTLEGLKDGRINIVVGTHALLSKDIVFKNLGLLVIDEEQHFGVVQKEKLKQLRHDVHVLTLTATPIPRTLQLALSGVRELSIIASPPIDRLAVRTFVTPFDPVVIREAIQREHHRGGKIFYVTPRIEYLGQLKLLLSGLVPEIRMVTAHGQMAPSALDETMNAFYEGKFDLLLSTSIVESGLDVREANTIIIDRAHMFGLSQLYQLRGRVGRGKARAYAYYTLPHHINLSRAATRRLEVMQTLDSLGAGFTLASHDMDIRGFGNLLGEEQSGHVREVGIELYQQMLEEAIAQVKSTQEKRSPAPRAEEWSPQINMGMTVLIPESYVPDLELRLTLYRRAAALTTEEENHAFAAELVDRFGHLPQEVEHLLAVMRLKQLCREAGVERVDAGPKGAVLTFRNNSFAKPGRLVDYIAKNATRAKLRPDHKLVLTRDWNDANIRLQDMHHSMSEIATL